MVEVVPSIADRAALLRARYRVRLPDALHLATAIESGATHFLTNDERLRKVNEVVVLVLKDHVSARA